MVDKGKIKTTVEQALNKAVVQALPLVQETIDKYLFDLEAHIGKIPGTGSSDLGWKPLDEDTEAGHRFWYETGAVAKHIVSSVSIVDNKIIAVAGLPSSAPGYQEAIWNEFGWMPHGTSKLVRRALFIPLAEVHIRELNELLKRKFSKLTLQIRVKI